MADRVIYKYEINKFGHNKVMMPKGARVLSCGMQQGSGRV
jgi:hypothetical protein